MGADREEDYYDDTEGDGDAYVNEEEAYDFEEEGDNDWAERDDDWEQQLGGATTTVRREQMAWIKLTRRRGLKSWRRESETKYTTINLGVDVLSTLFGAW